MAHPVKKRIKDVLPEFLTVNDAIEMGHEQTRELHLKHLNRLAMVDYHAKYFSTADGVSLIDEDGNEHIDMAGAVGVVTVGNNNEFVFEQIKKSFEAKQFMMGSLTFHSAAGVFGHNMEQISPGKKLSKIGTAAGGAEAVEGAIKLVKLATRNEPKKTHILSCIDAFHGKTTGALSVGGRAQWREHQEPLMGNVDHIPFNDPAALEEALKTGKYKAFFVEPIQGEAGIIVPDDGYLTKVRELCTKYDTIMVCDEIQTGCARTGAFWAVDHENVVPDVILFAKGFSGGLIPFAGYNCTAEVYEAAFGSIETAHQHTATFKENTLSTVAGIATLQYIYENDLITQAKEKGEYMIEKMRQVQKRYPGIIKDVRGRGLIIGLEFENAPEKFAKEYPDGNYAMKINFDLVDNYRIQVINVLNNPHVFRYLPALTITYDQIDRGVEALDSAVKTVYDHVNG